MSDTGELRKVISTLEGAVRKYQRSLAMAEAKLEAVRELHRPEIRYVVSEDGGSFDSEEEALDSFIGAFDSPAEEELARSEAKACLTTLIICKACSAINTSAMEDADEWVYLPEVYFPCPTRQAIDGED